MMGKNHVSRLGIGAVYVREPWRTPNDSRTFAPDGAVVLSSGWKPRELC